MSSLNVKSLREQFYKYIRSEMFTGRIQANTIPNLNPISFEQGLS